jgi:hypothetical protein
MPKIQDTTTKKQLANRIISFTKALSRINAGVASAVPAVENVNHTDLRLSW